MERPAPLINVKTSTTGKKTMMTMNALRVREQHHRKHHEDVKISQ
jgi:hypothetical protein